MQTFFLPTVTLLISLMDGILHFRYADYPYPVAIKLRKLKAIINIGIGMIYVARLKQSFGQFFQ